MPANAKKRELTAMSLFHYMTDEEMTAIAPKLETRCLAASNKLLTFGHSGSGVYFLRCGLVKICAPSGGSDEERDAILNICGQGEVLGEMDAMTGNGHSAHVITLDRSEFWWMSTVNFRACLTQHPKLHCNLNQILVERVQRLSAKDNARTTLALEGRVARQILLLARDYGIPIREGVMLPIHLAQRDLAALVGATRERVNRVLAYFRQRGLLLSDSKGRLIISDYESLGSYCVGCVEHISLLEQFRRNNQERFIK